MENIELIQKTAIEAAGKRLIYGGESPVPSLVIVDKDQTIQSLERHALGRQRYRGAAGHHVDR